MLFTFEGIEKVTSWHYLVVSDASKREPKYILETNMYRMCVCGRGRQQVMHGDTLMMLARKLQLEGERERRGGCGCCVSVCVLPSCGPLLAGRFTEGLRCSLTEKNANTTHSQHDHV